MYTGQFQIRSFNIVFYARTTSEPQEDTTTNFQENIDIDVTGESIVSSIWINCIFF